MDTGAHLYVENMKTNSLGSGFYLCFNLHIFGKSNERVLAASGRNSDVGLSIQEGFCPPQLLMREIMPIAKGSLPFTQAGPCQSSHQAFACLQKCDIVQQLN